MLKGQDIIILLLLRLRSDQSWTYEALSKATGLSTSQCHLAHKRLRESGLVNADSSEPWKVPISNCLEFILHGLRYVFPAKISATSRGIPTAQGASFVKLHFVNEDPLGSAYVWRDPEGLEKGNSLEPIHSCQLRFAPGRNPESGNGDSLMYEVLVCIDLLRVGRARERSWAVEGLKRRLHVSR
jgi:hypothetical protein